MIATLLAWGDTDKPPVLTLHTDCGHTTTAKIVCAQCGGELNGANSSAVAGPGANPGLGTALIGDCKGAI